VAFPDLFEFANAVAREVVTALKEIQREKKMSFGFDKVKKITSDPEPKLDLTDL
jgi:hypothetical protein